VERLSDLTQQLRSQSDRIDFLHAVRCLALAKGDLAGGARAAMNYGYGRVASILQKANEINAGDTTTSGWASQLAAFYQIAGEWINAVSKLTILGKLNYVRTPFRTRTILSADAVTADFVAAGAAIPAGQGSLSATATLDVLKLGIIAITTEDLLLTWPPGAQQQLENILRTAIVRGMDRVFMSEVAAVAAERPAGVLAGVAPLTSMTNSAASATSAVETILQAQVSAGSDLTRVLIAMHPATALTMALMKNSNGDAAFPALTATGGSIVGIPVATSVACVRAGSPSEKLIAAIDGAKVCVADDGEATVDASRVTSVAMSSVPSSQSTATSVGEASVSMFQVHSAAVKLTRAINWQKASTDAVSWATSTF
jgi:HK97 family phage major capsid protein